MEIKIYRDHYDIGCNIIRSRKIDFKPGVTILIGCNGAGKTTLLHNVRDECRELKIPCHIYDNLTNGGSDGFGAILAGMMDNNSDSQALGLLMASSSEGENIKINIHRQSTLYDEFISSGHYKNREYHLDKIFDESMDKDVADNRRVLLYDAVDSGLSIDNIIELKDMFDIILARAKDIGKELYIIISANEYELCRNSQCLDVQSGKYINITDYEDYRRFIINSRLKKEQRLDKQREVFKKRQDKEIATYKKIRMSVLKQIKEYKETHPNYKSWQIDNIKDIYRTFVRSCQYNNFSIDIEDEGEFE